jgi:hypothetical protein
MTHHDLDRDMGHALTALTYVDRDKEMKKNLNPADLRAAVIKDCKMNLEIFGPRFLNNLQENSVLSLTEPELTELREFVHALPKWKVV